jgi:hypothetical protein
MAISRQQIVNHFPIDLFMWRLVLREDAGKDAVALAGLLLIAGR